MEINYPPLMVTLELTLRCNAGCLHCGSAAGRERRGELSTGEIIKLIKDLANLGVKFITLLGGEPFLRDDWREIAGKIREYGMEISFITNGSLLSQKDVDFLRDLEPVGIGISLDGRREIHNAMRRMNLFDSALASLKMLRENSLLTGIITTVTKQNHDLENLTFLRDLVKSLDLSSWKIQVGHLTGRMHADLLLNKEEYYQLEQWISSQIQGGMTNIAVGDELGYCSSHEQFWRPSPWEWHGCSAGILHMGICSDGSVKGCLALPDEFIEGNIRASSIVQIWSEKTNFAYNRNFNSALLEGHCRDCEVKEQCRGGCRTFNYGFGSLFYSPYCLRVQELENEMSKRGDEMHEKNPAAVRF